MQEIKEIKNKLVDISLIIASIVGLPLLATSVVRSIDLNFLLFLYFHIGVYLAIVITAIFRKKLKYWFKALTIIVLLFFLATIDLQKTGFQGATYIWLMGAIILSALYFDLKTSMIVLIFSVFLLFYIMALHRLGRINYNIDFNQYLFLPYTIILKLLNITILGLMIAFSIKKVQNNLSRNLKELKQQKEDIERSAKKLSEEVETRKKSEQKAINNEKNFRNIFDQSSEALIIFDVDGSIIDFNDAFLSLTDSLRKKC
jgi:PAS domain-containing protein